MCHGISQQIISAISGPFWATPMLQSLQRGNLYWQQRSLSLAVESPDPAWTHGHTPMGFKLASPEPCATWKQQHQQCRGENLTLYGTTQCEHTCWLQSHARHKPGDTRSSLFCPSHQHSSAWTDHRISDEHKNPADLLYRWQEGKRKQHPWGGRQESCTNNALRAASKGDTPLSGACISRHVMSHTSATQPNARCCQLPQEGFTCTEFTPPQVEGNGARLKDSCRRFKAQLTT